MSKVHICGKKEYGSVLGIEQIASSQKSNNVATYQPLIMHDYLIGYNAVMLALIWIATVPRFSIGRKCFSEGWVRVSMIFCNVNVH